MSAKQKAVDFNQLVTEVTTGKQYGEADLAIWGGLCAETELAELLSKYSLNEMPFRIWEYASRIDFERDALPDEINLLERGRLFGDGGDLELRRDGANFRWRFIGKPTAQPPSSNQSAPDKFWTKTKVVTFHRCDESALLWGERKDGQTRWFDDRVGRASLDYPEPAATAAWQRVRICYWTFSRAGRVEFVWLRELAE
ncbi:MAG: CRISPR-associated protein Csx19 [Acidobacteriota bacterium]